MCRLSNCVVILEVSRKYHYFFFRISICMFPHMVFVSWLVFFSIFPVHSFVLLRFIYQHKCCVSFIINHFYSDSVLMYFILPIHSKFYLFVGFFSPFLFIYIKSISVTDIMDCYTWNQSFNACHTLLYLIVNLSIKVYTTSGSKDQMMVVWKS